MSGSGKETVQSEPPGAPPGDGWISRHEPGVQAVCLRALGNRGDALDASQEVLVKAERALARWRGEGSFAAWLFKIAANHCRDLLRSRRGRPAELSAQDLSDEEHPSVAGRGTDGSELAAVLDRLAAQLTPQQRQVFVLRDLQEVEPAEIARRLDLSPAAVRSHLCSARKALREALRARYPEFLDGVRDRHA